MFGLGFTEIVVILVVALLVFGPAKLPELARSLGKGLAEFRRASADIRSAVMDATHEPPATTPPPQGPADQVAAEATAAEQPPAPVAATTAEPPPAPVTATTPAEAPAAAPESTDASESADAEIGEPVPTTPGRD